MRNFITIKNEKERKIFLDYCKKHSTKLISGTKVTTNGKLFPPFEKCGFQVYFSEHFDYLTYSIGTIPEQKYGDYNEVKFNNFFGVSKSLELE